MLSGNPYDVEDSLGVESVLNYSFHQNSKGFSAADHWDPAYAIGADFLSCRLRLQRLIADSSWDLRGIVAKWHLPRPTVNSKTAMRWDSSEAAVAGERWMDFGPRVHRTFRRRLQPGYRSFV